MKALLFVTIVLVSGFAGGIVYGLVNLVTTEPFLDAAIELENRALFEAGEETNSPQFRAEYDSYRNWQKGGMILAGGILGTAIGSLFGIVFVYSKNILPGKHPLKKTLVLSALMWFTIFLIPFLKYPANPPTVGDPETVVLRSVLYLSFIAISGFGAVGFYQLNKKIKSKKITLVGYAAFLGLVFFLMPANPDEVSAPLELVNGFRLMSGFSMSIYWVTLALIFGLFWEKLRPDSSIEPKIS